MNDKLTHSLRYEINMHYICWIIRMVRMVHRTISMSGTMDSSDSSIVKHSLQLGNEKDELVAISMGAVRCRMLLQVQSEEEGIVVGTSDRTQQPRKDTQTNLYNNKLNKPKAICSAQEGHTNQPLQQQTQQTKSNLLSPERTHKPTSTTTNSTKLKQSVTTNMFRMICEWFNLICNFSKITIFLQLNWYLPKYGL